MNILPRFYIYWQDIAETCQLGWHNAVSLEEAISLAKIRVLFSGFKGEALITDRDGPWIELPRQSYQTSIQIFQVKWVGTEVQLFHKEGFKWVPSSQCAIASIISERKPRQEA